MILLCYGTRPELIKIFPLAIEMRKNFLNYQTLFTGQHKHLIKNFKYMIEKPTYKFNIFKKGQSIDRLYSKILRRCDKLFKKYAFDLVIVQGDTTSATAIAQSAFHHKIKIAHIEAGLRTYNKYSPFPEELNRHLISKFADYHFAPTKVAYENLIRENIINNVFLVGNTIVDSISYFKLKIRYKEQILITLHRRENLGKKIINLLKQINICAMKFQYTQFIFILHPNRKSEYSKYLIENNIQILPPQNYRDMLNIMAESLFIVTDSGGIQEEATCLGKRIIICRDTTERPEVVDLGFGKLVNNNILPAFDYFYQNYKIQANNPYGTDVSNKIVKILKEQLNYT